MPTKSAEIETQEALTDVLKSMQGMMSMNSVVTPQIEQFWKAQDHLLSEAEEYSRLWFKRRHEAARTALQTAREATFGDNPDPSKTMQAVAEWQRHSMERMVEDAREWFEMVSRCAKYVSETEADIIGENMEAASKVAGKAKS